MHMIKKPTHVLDNLDYFLLPMPWKVRHYWICLFVCVWDGSYCKTILLSQPEEEQLVFYKRKEATCPGLFLHGHRLQATALKL